MLHGRNADNSIHIDKFRLCKSAEKNCSEADPYYSGPACRIGKIRAVAALKKRKKAEKSAPIGALLLFVLKLEIERFDLERLESEL